MILVEEVMEITGSSAKGSWRLISAFKRSFIPDRSFMVRNLATMKVGRIAMVRVKRTRFHLGHLRSKNP